jgi:RNA polymerase sigma-70 factor (ECF subfamily)
MIPDVAADAAGGNDRFSTTRWSLILASFDSQSDESANRKALADLCRIYWRPIYTFISRRSRSKEDAEDLTQEFFVMILNGDLLRTADPERGRFRSLLLKSLQNFLIDAHHKAHARKRGGDAKFISWDEWMAEAPSRLVVPTTAQDNWPAERLFDVRWAATVAEQALVRLQDECEKRGRRRVFDALSAYLIAEREDVSYEPIAKELGTNSAEIKRLLFRLRQRYRSLLRAAVADTVDQASDIDDELRYLVSALSAGMSDAVTNR